MKNWSFEKVKLHFQYEDSAIAHGRELDETKDFFYNILLNKLNLIELNNNNLNVIIPKMEIDVAGKNLDELTDKIIASFQEQINVFLDNNEPYSQHYQHQRLNNNSPLPTSQKINIKDRLHILLDYLNLGTLPWNYPEKPQYTLQKEVLHFSKEGSAAEIQLLLNAITASQSVAERLWLQAGAKTMLLLFYGALKNTPHTLLIIEKLLHRLNSATIIHNSHPIVPVLLQAIALTIETNKNQSSINTIRQIPNYISNKYTASPLSFSQKDYHLSTTDTDDQLVEKCVTALSIIATDIYTLPNAESASDFTAANEHQQVLPSINGNEHYIENAGLILLGAYLPALFSGLKLTVNHQFQNVSEQQKAIHLLHYLVYENLEAPDHLCIFNKILCNWPVLQPIELNFDLEENMKTECNDLLNAVITNWKSLKGTSNMGFIETFIKRKGIILLENNEWILRVERKTVDILMEDIPWNFRLLSLPWNNYLLHVEW